MDSITQFTLGAAVGQVILGPKIGRNGAIIGGIAGSIPDLDSLFLANMDMVTQLVVHRGVSHSLLFCIIAPFILTPFCQILVRFFGKRPKKNEKTTHKIASQITTKEWRIFWFLAFLTHTIIDCFTSWGTQLFWPHPYRVALHSVFIIDPFYTIPLLIGVIRTLRTDRLRPVYIGLMISSLYLFTTFGIKMVVNYQFEKGFKNQGITVSRYIAKPTPFNCFLWAVTADAGDHYVYGYYSIFDGKTPDVFTKSEPKNHHLLAPYKDNKSLQHLLFFTQDFYLVDEKTEPQITIYDGRYGRFGDWDPGYNGVYIFTYLFDPKTNTFEQTRPRVDNMGELFQSLMDRI